MLWCRYEYILEIPMGQVGPMGFPWESPMGFPWESQASFMGMEMGMGMA